MLGPCLDARSTSATRSVPTDVGVDRVVGVAKRTMSLRGVGSPYRLASQLVLLGGHRVEVGGVDASSHPTQMIDLESGWHGPHMMLVGPSVGIVRIVVQTERSVPLGVDSPRPEPTWSKVRSGSRHLAMLVDFCEEAFGRRSSGWQSGAAQAFIAAAAQLPSQDRLLASIGRAKWLQGRTSRRDYFAIPLCHGLLCSLHWSAS